MIIVDRWNQVSLHLTYDNWDFSGGPVFKNLPLNAGDLGSIPGRGMKIHMLQGN